MNDYRPLFPGSTKGFNAVGAVYEIGIEPRFLASQGEFNRGNLCTRRDAFPSYLLYEMVGDRKSAELLRLDPHVIGKGRECEDEIGVLAGGREKAECEVGGKVARVFVLFIWGHV